MTADRKRGRPAHPDVLTPGEWRVAHAVRHGMTNRQIAERRRISIDAVKFHVTNILLKLGMSRRAELRSWTGIPAESSLQKEERMSGLAIVGPLGQISRKVGDIAAATEWYRDTLGLTHLYSFGDLAFFDCGGTRLFLSQGSGDGESILYFRVADARLAQTALESQGVAFTHAAHMIHRHDDGAEEWMAFFADNEGRPLAVMSRTEPAATPIVPPGFTRVFPYIVAKNARAYLDFLAGGLGGEIVDVHTAPDGQVLNAHVRFGDTTIMVSDPREPRQTSRGEQYLYVADADAAMARAIAAGAQAISPVGFRPYGERQGGISDPAGNVWWLSQRLSRGGY